MQDFDVKENGNATEIPSELFFSMLMHSERGLAIDVDLRSPCFYFMQLSLIWDVLKIFTAPSIPKLVQPIAHRASQVEPPSSSSEKWPGMCLRLTLSNGELWLVENLTDSQSNGLCVNLSDICFNMRLRPDLRMNVCATIDVVQRVRSRTQQGPFCLSSTEILFSYAMFSQSKEDAEARLMPFWQHALEELPEVAFSGIDMAVQLRKDADLKLSADLSGIINVVQTFFLNLWGPSSTTTISSASAPLAITPITHRGFDMSMNVMLQQLNIIVVDSHLGHALTLLRVQLEKVAYRMDAENFIGRICARLQPLSVQFFNYRKQGAIFKYFSFNFFMEIKKF
jgi:hypothetical protein